MKTITAIFAAILFTMKVSAATPPADMLYKTAFSLMGEKSYYDASGNLLATSRYISDASLPLPVVKKLMKKCPDYQIRYIREFESGGINTYIITLENETGYKVVRCTKSAFSVLQQLDKN